MRPISQVAVAAVTLLSLSGIDVDAQSETVMYDHVHLAVPEPAAAASWYARHFDGEPVDGRDDRTLIGVTRGPNDLTFVNGTISVFFIDGPRDVTIEVVQRARNMR